LENEKIMTIPIPRAVREFVAGIRAIQESIPTLHAVKKTLDQLMREVENVDVANMQRLLEAERIAHDRTLKAFDEETSNMHSLANQLSAETAAHEATRASHGEMRRALGEAERKLDALTRW
jgi:hypothetical protein